MGRGGAELVVVLYHGRRACVESRLAALLSTVLPRRPRSSCRSVQVERATRARRTGRYAVTWERRRRRAGKGRPGGVPEMRTRQRRFPDARRRAASHHHNLPRGLLARGHGRRRSGTGRARAAARASSRSRVCHVRRDGRVAAIQEGRACSSSCLEDRTIILHGALAAGPVDEPARGSRSCRKPAATSAGPRRRPPSWPSSLVCFSVLSVLY